MKFYKNNIGQKKIKSPIYATREWDGELQRLQDGGGRAGILGQGAKSQLDRWDRS